jgi:uncharacterized protein HemX
LAHAAQPAVSAVVQPAWNIEAAVAAERIRLGVEWPKDRASRPGASSMDKQLSTGTVAAIIAVVVVILGLAAWRFLGNQAASQEQQQRAQQGIQQDYMRRMQSGPPGGPPGPH